MKKLKNIYSAKYLPPVLLVFAVLAPILFNAFRCTWVFIDIALHLDGFTLFLLCLMIANAVAVGVLWALRLYEVKRAGKPVYQKKAYAAAIIVTCLLTLLFFTAAIVYAVIAALKESAGVAMLYLRKSLPEVAFFVLVPVLAVFLPKAGEKVRKPLVSLILAGAVIFGVGKIFPLTTYEITCDPMVIDNGTEYSVVFSTSDVGTGYICYTYAGQEYRVFDESAGRLNCDSKIHSVPVPYEHLKGNAYRVGSTHVIEEYSYGSRLGKDVVSQEYDFSVNESENQTYLVVSDWHTELDAAYAAVGNLGTYDAVILMGDASPGVDFEDEFVKNTVEFAGVLSKGVMPVLYVRGNHETRGAYAGKIQEALGLDEFYRVNSIGPISFVVLDSSEDKADSHPEYGGLDDYGLYRAEMLEWLKSTNVENKKVIALSHSWKISDVEEDLSLAGWQELQRLGARLMISGHTHNCRLIGQEDAQEKAFLDRFPNIIGYMDGGVENGVYTASKLTLSENEIRLTACNNNGEQVFDQTFHW